MPSVGFAGCVSIGGPAIPESSISMLSKPRRRAWRLCQRHARVLVASPPLARHNEPPAALRRALGGELQQRQMSSGMDAFMEFEREMAMKRRREQAEQAGASKAPAPAVPLTPPVKPGDDECCHLNCPNCVLLVYYEKLMEYELSLEGRQVKPTIPPSKYNVAFLDEQNLTQLQRETLAENDQAAFPVIENSLISAPHRTKDGAKRSVRHIDLEISDEQQWRISAHASNIGVYAPNSASVVDSVAAFLGVDQDLMFLAEPLAIEKQENSDHEQQESPERPFARIGKVNEALTWAFDLMSTPRSSFLRTLAAYATDPDEIAKLSAPQAAEALQAQRPMKQISIADIFAMFPSVRIDFQSFYQIAPLNALRYYTVSSSHKYSPHTVSITLGLREVEEKPLPRCSSYLASLVPGQDRVRASFLRSSFVFPYHDRRPIMLISAGTGIAPFRAFLQDLEYERSLEIFEDKSGDVTKLQQRRNAYLFYGCRSRDTDFLYAADIDRAQSEGILDAVNVEFSDGSNSATGEKRYVQDGLADHSELIARHLMEENGYIYVCGGLEMGRAVKRTLAQALLAHPELSNASTEIEARRLIARQLATHQIVTELW